MRRLESKITDRTASRVLRLAALVLLFVLPSGVSCGGGAKKPNAKTNQQKTAQQKKRDAQAAPVAATVTAPDGSPVFGEYNDQLIADADLDQFKGQFNTDVGREDPFEFVPYNTSGVGDIEKGVRENPDLYRVIGTARTTPSGPAALIQMGGETFIVHEGDEIDKAIIKRIDERDVLIEMGGKEFTLSMRTRKRTIPAPDMTAAGMEQTQLGKLSSQMGKFDSLYEEYLNSKYGKTDFFEGERKKGPENFTDYLKEHEKETFDKKEESPF